MLVGLEKTVLFVDALMTARTTVSATTRHAIVSLASPGLTVPRVSVSMRALVMENALIGNACASMDLWELIAL